MEHSVCPKGQAGEVHTSWTALSLSEAVPTGHSDILSGALDHFSHGHLSQGHGLEVNITNDQWCRQSNMMSLAAQSLSVSIATS